jgi:hypothetical protein
MVDSGIQDTKDAKNDKKSATLGAIQEVASDYVHIAWRPRHRVQL